MKFEIKAHDGPGRFGKLDGAETPLVLNKNQIKIAPDEAVSYDIEREIAAWSVRETIAKAKEAKVIVITANRDSILARNADALLLLPNAPESDRYGVMSTTSFAATMAIFDALMVALMEEKDYQLSEFALIHPGGAVGKQIN